MIINGHNIPNPAREPLADQEQYWIPSLQRPLFPTWELWTGHASDYDFLRAGLIHTDPYAAIRHAKALISITAKP